MHYTPKDAYQWKKKPQVVDTLYGKGISIPFTWQYSEGLRMADRLGTTLIGGPGATLLGCSSVDGGDIIQFFNPYATFTTRGCIRKCQFCAVPALEGNLRELPTWRQAPIVCDNNLLASSHRHFQKVIDTLVPFGWADFNQGLDFRLLKVFHLTQFSRIKYPKLRLSFDDILYESAFVDAVSLIKNSGYKNLSAYVLIGFHDTPDDALYRLQLCWALGVWPNPMRYQPIDSLKKNSYVEKG